eukprot:Amastigsp_a690486_6.p3 type:complete len:113 gc:universal Amastigsp_a690486_6:204-542(+)
MKGHLGEGHRMPRLVQVFKVKARVPIAVALDRCRRGRHDLIADRDRKERIRHSRDGDRSAFNAEPGAVERAHAHAQARAGERRRVEDGFGHTHREPPPFARLERELQNIKRR